MTRLIIHAPNVHQGGGASLLNALLLALPEDREVVVLHDSRMQILGGGLKARCLPVVPSILQRFNAEVWLSKNVCEQDTVLCFGNLPPLLRLTGRVVVFVQNRYLIEDVKLNEFAWKSMLRLGLERLWLSARMGSAHKFIVQTPSMKRLLETRAKVPVCVLPFMEGNEDYVRELPPSEIRRINDFDFFYVASGESHKNHRRLIEAWCLLTNEGFYPSLKLTLDKAKFPELCDWIERQATQCRLNLENLGNLPHKTVVEFYDRAGALIYPSTFESFGLPLIEARQAGLPILASELDYVRDVVDPEETFDPSSAASIARAVKRFMGRGEPALPLQDAKGFLKHICETAG